MKLLFTLVVAVLPAAALAQTNGPTPEQLRTLQLRLDEQQQQVNQQRLRQPSTPQRDQQLQSLQNQLDQQQIELQRLKQQQQSCLHGRC
jgi:dethiobiotin synthetase